MIAQVIAVGTELLIGQVVNTNATWLARELAALGIDLHRVVTVGDNLDRMVQTIRQAWDEADLVICTGGLGPTPDDLTTEAVALAFGLGLAERPGLVRHIEELFARRGRKMTPMDRKQAVLPEGCEEIPNPSGTATGTCLAVGGKQLFTFPGVPRELEAMWQSWAMPRLQAASSAVIHSTLLKFVGRPEAEIAQVVRDLLDSPNPSLAPYTAQGEVHLRLTAKGGSREEVEALVAPLETEILARLGASYFGRDTETLPAVVGRVLRSRSQSVATAESVTGGLLASRITDIAGSSDYFSGGTVVYSEQEKMRLLGVPARTLADHGHVSAETTMAMALGTRERSEADWAIATTGFAGPGPTVPADMLGHVFVAVAGPNGQEAQRRFTYGNHPRDQVKYFATQAALGLLLRCLQEHPGA